MCIGLKYEKLYKMLPCQRDQFNSQISLKLIQTYNQIQKIQTEPLSITQNIMIRKGLQQCYGIVIKNLLNHWANKKKFFGQFIFPLFISGLYILMQSQKESNPFISIILGVLLKLQISMICLSAIKELVTLFLNEREKKFRQYQMIFGLGSRAHTLSNLFYMGLYMSFFLVPFYLTLNYYKIDLRYIGVFAAFVISTMSCTMMMSAFFRDQKLATEFISTLFSLSGFLVLMYSGGNVQEDGSVTYSTLDYLAMFFPNSSFAIAIMYDTPWVSLYSISIVKIYLLTYSVMEFPRQWKEMLLYCYRSVKRCLTGSQQQSHVFTEDFNLNDQISQNFSPNDRVNIEPQKNMVKISNLVKTYKIKQGQFNALNKINMTIQKRQIFGLLGRNGAGKTTLVDILTDIARPSSGHFYINFEKNTDQDIQKIGICYQNEILYEDMTVEEHLYFYCRIKNVKSDYAQTIQSIVNMLRIQDEYKKKVRQLSGGNKRKVSIAIAVLGNPQMMIFDEPTSGLDPLSRRAVWQILEQLRKDFNSSIILTTHHLDEAEVLSDWICVIEKGSVVVQNSPDQIKQKYGNGYYLTLEFSSVGDLSIKLPSITSYLEETLSRVEVLQKEHNRCRLFLKFQKQNFQNKLISQGLMREEKWQCQESKLLKVLEWLNDVEDLKIQVEKNSLEQSFIAILKDPENGIAANNSGDSIQLANVIQRPTQQRKSLEEYQSEPIIQKLKLLSSQVYGVFLRCIYFHKGSSVRFFMSYNINIVIFLFFMLFNKFVLEVVNKSRDNDDGDGAIMQQQAQKNHNYSNNMLTLQGYIIMAGAFIILPMYEKEKNIRRVFNSRGVWQGAYWVGNFLFDYGYFLLNLFVMSKFITPQSFKFLQQTQKGMFLFIQLGIGMVLYAYAATALFQKLSTANTWFSLINLLFGFIVLPMIILGEKTFLGHFAFIKYIYPYYDLNIILMKESLKGVTGEFGSALMGSSGQKQYVWFSVGFYFAVLVLVEIRIWDRVKDKFWNKVNVQNCEHNIQLKNVSKKYADLQALKNVNYHVANQRLALLGHNGAGKSTTFGLLSGQINPTSGQLFLQHKTKLNHQKIMRSAGICYQQDCLWQSCSPLEILDIFSYLVPIEHSGKEIEWLLESLQFESMNFNKRFEDLSGGNKRKICMAVGLYGDPMIRLLDECSTGLDPSSRVAMVETIKNSGSGSTIFTTHSMSEAENLCSKTVIMGKGQVLEFDHIYKLKQKYYNCYWIDVVMKSMDVGVTNELQGNSFVENNIELIKKTIKQIVYELRYQQVNGKKVDLYKNLPKILKVTKQSKMRLEFDKTVWPIYVALKVAYAFRDALQQKKSQILIESIYITQPKLEDVYIRVTSDSFGHHSENSNENSKVYEIETEQIGGNQEDERKSGKGKPPQFNKDNCTQEIQLMEI